jgi:signal transduction histidine kinase
MKIIDKHKGVICANGNEEEGLKFVLVLPLKEEVAIEMRTIKKRNFKDVYRS